MFEKSMLAQLKRIFGLDKVTFDLPGESQEQEAAFVRIDNARVKIIDARQIARVTGTLTVFASLDKLPYGYFGKCIAEANPSDTRPFIFSFEENKGTYRNIAERTVDFVYLFDSQYDPAIGIINQVTLSYDEDES